MERRANDEWWSNLSTVWSAYRLYNEFGPYIYENFLAEPKKKK